MTAYATYIILGIAHEEGFIVRIWSINRVSQPEILPYHNAMTVAGLIETFISNLSYPVANHRVVHILMIPYSNVVLTGAVE